MMIETGGCIKLWSVKLFNYLIRLYLLSCVHAFKLWSSNDLSIAFGKFNVLTVLFSYKGVFLGYKIVDWLLSMLYLEVSIKNDNHIGNLSTRGRKLL